MFEAYKRKINMTTKKQFFPCFLTLGESTPEYIGGVLF
jgi:hypothetical protein